MTFKPAIWFPIAVVLTVVNVVAVWFAARTGGALHATIHAGLAVTFGTWALRLRRARAGSQRQVGREAAEALDALEALEIETSNLRQELIDTQERLEFAERRLTQQSDVRASRHGDPG